MEEEDDDDSDERDPCDTRHHRLSDLFSFPYRYFKRHIQHLLNLEESLPSSSSRDLYSYTSSIIVFFGDAIGVKRKRKGVRAAGDYFLEHILRGNNLFNGTVPFLIHHGSVRTLLQHSKSQKVRGLIFISIFYLFMQMFYRFSYTNFSFHCINLDCFCSLLLISSICI